MAATTSFSISSDRHSEGIGSHTTNICRPLPRPRRSRAETPIMLDAIARERYRRIAQQLLVLTS